MAREQKRMRYYLIEIYGDVEPSLHGPFKDERTRDAKALKVRAADPYSYRRIYPLDQLPNGELTVRSYSGAFFEHGARHRA